MIKVAVIREEDDPTADVRISIGSPRESEDFYFVFRGEPEKVLKVLQNATVVAAAALPAGNYEDRT